MKERKYGRTDGSDGMDEEDMLVQSCNPINEKNRGDVGIEVRTAIEIDEKF